MAYGAFGGDVGADVEAAAEGQDGGDVDDFVFVIGGRRGVGLGVREPVFREGAGEDEGGCQVDLDNLFLRKGLSIFSFS